MLVFWKYSVRIFGGNLYPEDDQINPINDWNQCHLCGHGVTLCVLEERTTHILVFSASIEDLHVYSFLDYIKLTYPKWIFPTKLKVRSLSFLYNIVCEKVKENRSNTISSETQNIWYKTQTLYGKFWQQGSRVILSDLTFLTCRLADKASSLLAKTIEI